MQTSVIITSCLFLAALCEAGLLTAIAASGAILAETRATTDETEYASFWVFQWRTLPDYRQYVWVFLASLVRSFVKMLITLVVYRCCQRVSCRENEKLKQKVLQKGKIFVRQLRGALAFIQEMKERRDRFRNAVEPLKKLVKVEKGRHDRFQNEMDSMRKMMKAHEESQAQFQNEMVRMETMLKMEDGRRVQFRKRMNSMKTKMKAAQKLHPLLHNKVESMKRTGATKFS